MGWWRPMTAEGLGGGGQQRWLTAEDLGGGWWRPPTAEGLGGEPEEPGNQEAAEAQPQKTAATWRLKIVAAQKQGIAAAQQEKEISAGQQGQEAQDCCSMGSDSW